MSLDEQVKSLTERVDILSKDLTKITEAIACNEAGLSQEVKELIDDLVKEIKQSGLKQWDTERFTLIVK